MESIQRPRVFLDVSIGEQPAGRLTIELFTDKTPKTAENFRRLCTGEHDGLSYALSPFHRVIDEFMVQGGDITKGDGTGGKSIYGGEFEDENLNWREMDAAGLVASANRGKDTNGSQFFVTLEACPHLNGKHTIFGRLVSGEDTLQRIAAVDVDKNDRPIEPVLISRCGELERKKKKKAARESVSPTRDSQNRGRRRRSIASEDGDIRMQDSPQPHHRVLLMEKGRRQSDNVVDEGLRGRPRQRSGSRSASRAVSSASESDEDSFSPASMHKRKRSTSPSRHDRRHDEERVYERRRRSLPNQYSDGKDNSRRDRGYAEEDRYRPSPRRDNYRRNDRTNDDARERRRDDRYRPSAARERYAQDGRLDSGRSGRQDRESYNNANPDPPINYKGRGRMTYMEPDSYGRL